MTDINETYLENIIFNQDIKVIKDLMYKELSNCQFYACHLSTMDFSGTLLEECLFKECHLSLVDLKGTKLRDVKFENCKIEGVDFSKCDTFIIDMDLEGCLIRNCSFSNLNLKKHSFKRSQIIDSDFFEMELEECDFSNTVLTGTTFENCNLSKANFTNAKDYHISLSFNNIKKAVFTLPDAVGLLKDFDVVIK